MISPSQSGQVTVFAVNRLTWSRNHRQHKVGSRLLAILAASKIAPRNRSRFHWPRLDFSWGYVHRGLDSEKIVLRQRFVSGEDGRSAPSPDLPLARPAGARPCLSVELQLHPFGLTEPMDDRDHITARLQVILEQLNQFVIGDPGYAGIVGQHAERLALCTPVLRHKLADGTRSPPGIGENA
jgi:hypothetical protein